MTDAIECFQIVADTYPNAASYYNLSMMLFKNRRFKRSAQALEKSVELEETPSRLIALARIYRVTGQYDKQISTLKRAVQVDENNISIIQLLAEAYLHENQELEAKKQFRRILKLDPKNPRARQAIEPIRTLKKVR